MILVKKYLHFSVLFTALSSMQFQLLYLHQEQHLLHTKWQLLLILILAQLVTSAIYFALVFLFAMNRTKVLSLLGRFLTPLIFLILVAIIFIGMFSATETMNPSIFETPFISGLLEGYQTFDAIGAVVVGGVLVISMNFNKDTSFEAKKELITKAGFIAGLGLLVIYTGLIYNGALFNSIFSNEATRAEVLSNLSTQTLR